MLHAVLAFFFAVIALLLMVLILLQRGKGVGLSVRSAEAGGGTPPSAPRPATYSRG